MFMCTADYGTAYHNVSRTFGILSLLASMSGSAAMISTCPWQPAQQQLLPSGPVLWQLGELGGCNAALNTQA